MNKYIPTKNRKKAFFYDKSTPSKPSKTSSATPPFSKTARMMLSKTANLVPPSGAFQTPS